MRLQEEVRPDDGGKEPFSAEIYLRNANGPLGAYLTFYGKLPPREEGFAFTIKQGEAIGRKGYMKVIVRSFGGDPVIVKVGGRARIVFKTEIGL